MIQFWFEFVLTLKGFLFFFIRKSRINTILDNYILDFIEADDIDRKIFWL